MARFKCVSVGNGLWTVWDDLKEVAATLGGKELTGMPLHQAQTTRDILERIETSRLTGHSSPPN